MIPANSEVTSIRAPTIGTTNMNPLQQPERDTSRGEKNDANIDVSTDVTTPLFSFLTGMRDDLKVRAPLYADDWARPKSIYTVVNATLFAFVIQLIPALIFAELIDRETEGNLATAEVLLSSAIIGTIYAIFSGQPLVIMGITGPVAILLGTSFSLTEKFDADYFPFFFWICIWAGLLHIISAMIGLVNLVWKVTPFTSQIFELFIAITFIYTSVRDLIEPIKMGQGRNSPERGAKLATLVIGLLTFYIAWTLHFAESWIFFPRQIRIFLASYNTLIAIVMGTAFSYLPGVEQAENGFGGIDRVNVSAPWNWQPTANRPWLVSPFEGIDATGIFAAMIPGLMFFLLFIIDHNVSSILTQSPKFNLTKPPAYHWDFFVLGLTFIPCAMLGLPPGNGLIPQAPMHCHALCTRKTIVDPHGVKREVVTYVEEQRWSGLVQALLMFVALASFTVIAWIPRGCLFGLFLYFGIATLTGNEIWERITLGFIMKKKRPEIPVVREVNWTTVQVFTAVQFACAFSIFAVAQFADIGYLYPALLTLLVPFRSVVLSRFFTAADLKHLDPADETEDDYHQEQRAIHLAELQGSSDVDDVGVPTRAAFRPNGMANEIRHRHDTSTHSMEITDAAVGVDAPPVHETAKTTESLLRSDVEGIVRHQSKFPFVAMNVALSLKSGDLEWLPSLAYVFSYLLPVPKSTIFAEWLCP